MEIIDPPSDLREGVPSFLLQGGAEENEDLGWKVSSLFFLRIDLRPCLCFFVFFFFCLAHSLGSGIFCEELPGDPSSC